MFPHTITIYHFNEDTQIYEKQVVKGVWWSGSDSVNISTQRAHSGTTQVVVPKALMNTKVYNGDHVAKGETKDITSASGFEDLECFEVSSIQVNDAGWDIDNLVIGGN